MFERGFEKVHAARLAQADAWDRAVHEVKLLGEFSVAALGRWAREHDPVTGKPYAAVFEDGRVQTREYSLTIKLFDDSHITFVVDPEGTISAAAEPNVLKNLSGRIVGVQRDGDAPMVVIEGGGTLPFSTVLSRLVKRAAKDVVD